MNIKNLPTYEEALTKYKKGSHKKVITKCNNCKTTSIKSFRDCHDKKRCNKCYRNKKDLTFKEAQKTLTNKSKRKVIFNCPTCYKESLREYKNCTKAKYCKHCYSEKLSEKSRIPAKSLSLEDAFSRYSKRSKVLVNLKCPKCSSERVSKLSDIKVNNINEAKSLLCSKCVGVQVSETKLNKVARINGYESYKHFAIEVIKYLEKTGYGPGSAETLIKFKTTRSTLDNLIRREDRKDLITDNSTSSTERELIKHIKSNYSGIIVENDRFILKPKELDIYLPELNIAIEYNGLWWHSSKFVDKNYHYNKYKKCLDQDIKLYTIWSHVYEKNPLAVYNFITNLISKKTRIYARKCTIIEDKSRIRAYINKHHLQGVAPSHTYLGLEHEGKLVMAISISKHHRGLNLQVLNRVCFSEYNVVGGLKKLLKRCPKPLTTWSDNCYSPIGQMYKNAGFELEVESPPDYFYCDRNGKFLSKHSQMKSKTKCPPNLTELEWATKRGLFRIWDCGKKRWVLK